MRKLATRALYVAIGLLNLAILAGGVWLLGGLDLGPMRAPSVAQSPELASLKLPVPAREPAGLPLPKRET